MDSGNSESLQSSGGDDEYGSRAAGSSLLRPIFNPLSQSQPSPMFDPLSNYFDPPISSSRPHNPNPLLSLDMGWPKSHPNPSDPNSINPFFPFPQLTQNIPPASAAAAAASASSSMVHAPSDQAQPHTHVARNPKKRSRASRRAPTTVLTTDTKNFRAMVQEFTGIPAPPFTSSSVPFPRTRLSLFGTPSYIRSNASSSSICQPPPYHNHHHNLLRPFPQKAQPLVNGTNNITTTSASNLPSELGLLNPPRPTSKNLLDNMQIQSPILTFQSFLQSPKYPLHEIALNDSSHLKTGVSDEFGLTHGPQVANGNNAHIISWLPSLVSSDRASPRNENGDGNGYNYSGSSSNFHGGKEFADNVSVSTTRGEGLNMESWICSSD